MRQQYLSWAYTYTRIHTHTHTHLLIGFSACLGTRCISFSWISLLNSHLLLADEVLLWATSEGKKKEGVMRPNSIAPYLYLLHFASLSLHLMRLHLSEVTASSPATHTGAAAMAALHCKLLNCSTEYKAALYSARLSGATSLSKKRDGATLPSGGEREKLHPFLSGVFFF